MTEILETFRGPVFCFPKSRVNENGGKKCVNSISIKFCSFTLQNMLIKLIISVNFNEAHIANHLMHLTETFAVKLLQIVVSDASSKKVPARILLIELTKTINFSRLNVTKNANL